MNFRVISKYMGNILMLEGAFMLPAILVALIYKEYSSIPAFLITIALCLIIGYGLSKVKQNSRGIYAKEAYVSVALGWLILSTFGCLPFIISGYIPNFIDAFFETVSGFTTTGSSVVLDVEAMSKGILFWRSFTHWVGGMGVLVFVMAIVPNANDRSIHIMRAEMPGPIVGKLVPKASETARILYLIYIGEYSSEFFYQ